MGTAPRAAFAGARAPSRRRRQERACIGCQAGVCPRGKGGSQGLPQGGPLRLADTRDRNREGPVQPLGLSQQTFDFVLEFSELPLVNVSSSRVRRARVEVEGEVPRTVVGRKALNLERWDEQAHLMEPRLVAEPRDDNKISSWRW